ncbi:uncharacterized protein Dmoj_GI14106, isoform C [Drosophila mojavensis]|uniref:Uncharacterized protein, isoform C n=2 Tax=Drosophila mojavensis TaxID=7230 RepID=B4L7D8_DROMO|nr:uncharacterized protein Dmoj_GI14106, isoform C [Drosophila mojavensis]
MAVNNCQLNLNSATIQQDLNTAAIYNLTGHRAAAAACGSNSGIIETNCRLLSDISKSSQVGPNNSQQQQQQQLTTVAGVGNNSNNGCSNNSSIINGSSQSIITLANSHGLTLGSSNNPSAYMHDKSLLGAVGVSVGVGINVSCIDNRKYDYKNNNLLSNSNFQQASQEYVSTGNNSSGNSRSNQQSGIYRGPQAASNPPRGNGTGGGARAPHVHMPPMYPNMVLQNYPQYGQRQPAYPAPHLQYTHTPIPYYTYPYLSPLPQQQPPPHSRSGVAVNTNLGNTMQSVQPGGPNGPLAGPGGATPSQLQLLTGAVQPGANTVIGVGGTASGQVGVGVNVSVPPMVGVMSSNVTPQPVPVPQPSRRRHQHRLQIIDPTTKKNILDELDKSNVSTESDYQEAGAAAATAIAPAAPSLTTSAVVAHPDASMCITQPDAGGICLPPSSVLIQGPDARPNIQYKLDQIPAQRQDIIVGQTPVVSAMSDAPSVEILPSSQKNKSKKIPIVSPKDAPESSSSSAFSSFKVDDVSKTSVESANEPNQHLQSDFVAQEEEEEEQQHRQKSQQQPQQQQQESHSPFMAANTAEQQIVDIVEVGDSSEAVQQQQQQQQQQNNNEQGLTVIAVEVDSTAENVELSSTGTATSEVSVLPDNVSSMYITEPSLSTNLSETVADGQVEGEEAQRIVVPVVTSSHESTPDETDRAQQMPDLEATPIGENVKEENERNETLTKTISTNSLATAEDAKEVKDADIGKVVEPKKTETSAADEQQEAIADGVAMETSEIAASLINYNEGQWSPSNPSGKKQYDREQLLQLREAKASRIQPEVKNVSILPHPNLMPMFMRNSNNNNNNNNNKRVQSMVGIGGSRNSESIGNNFGGKQASMSGVQGGGGGRSSMKGMIHVNLSLNQDVKLNETENAWRPRLQNNKHQQDSTSGSNSDGNKSIHEKDELVRKVRGILNKLTPERFDTLVEEIIKLKIDTPEKMDEVIVLVFEKAIDEPNFSVSYARLCHRLISEVKARDERMESGTKSNLQHFRNALLDKTEKEFTQNVSQGAAKERKLQPIIEKIKKCNDPNEKAELEALLEEEERKIRRRSGGTVRFIGELFKISMLTGKIIYSCIDTLLNPQSEDMLECLCKLLTTVGAKFEQTPVSAKEPGRCYSLEKLIGRMQAIASKTDKDAAKVSSRVRFMLQDVIDLRKNKWQSTRNEAPKTMGQIEKEAKNEQLSAQYMNYSSSISTTTSTSSPNGGGSGGAGKRDARFGDARSSGGYGGSHSQRGGDGVSSMRHQQSNSGTGSGSGAGGSGNGNHSNGNNDDNTWHVQTSKGSRSQAVDSIKLEGLLNQNLDNKKMGGVNQFINWNNNAIKQSSTTPTTTPSNSFAPLSSLIDNKSSTDRDRSGGPRNKGSYHKGSIERDRYNDRGMHSRTGSSQGSRENSSSRVAQNAQNRGMMSSSMQKSASHSKYTQPTPASRLSNKSLGSSSLSSAGGIHKGIEQQQQQQPNLSSGSISASTSASQLQSTTKGIAPPATFIVPTESDSKLFKSVLSDILEADLMVAECIQRISEVQRCGFLYYILNEYLHLAQVGKQNRSHLANAIAQLIQQNYISAEHFKLAYNEFFSTAADLMFDVPELWLYILQFTGPLIVKKHLTITDLWNKNALDSSQLKMGKKFLHCFLTYCTREVGPSFTHSIWKKFNMRWSDYMPDNEVSDFIKSNRFEYVENILKTPVIDERDSHETHVQNVIDHIEQLLKEGSTADEIIDYINGNIVVADKLFIRGLTETLCKFAIVYKDNSYKLDPELFQKFCIPVFQRFIGSNEDLQLECLYGVQLLVHSWEQPRGLLSELFGELYDGFVIQKESLYKWRDSKDHSAGKGVAVKSVNPFLNSLFNDEAN